MLSTARVATGVVVLGLAASGVAGALRWKAHDRREAVRASLRAGLPAARGDGFVTSNACRQCHPDQYASWHRSFHRQMTQVAGPDSVKGDFGDIDVTLAGRTYHLQRRGDQYWIELDAPPFAKDQSWHGELQVVMTTGSHHRQIYWFRDRKSQTLYMAPLAWLVPERKWVLRQHLFLVSEDSYPEWEERYWNFACINCHATGGQQRPREGAPADTRIGELGIACEACHGRGEEHVAANSDPTRRYQLHMSGEADPTIVNPARLSARASSQVCGMCHSVRVPLDEKAHAEHGEQFRPGEERDAHSDYIYPAHRSPDLPKPPDEFIENRFWPDGILRVTGREFNSLTESKCFNGGLACTSCHSVHKGQPSDQLKDTAHGDEVCFGCHGDMRARVSEHTHHPAASEGSRCMNCHMPFTTYGLLGAIRNHYIASPSVKNDLATGRPNACNLCHLDRTLAWTASAMTRLWGAPAVEVPADRSQLAEGVRWMLRGDANQRALVAWNAGWRPAQETAGKDWLAPYLAQLLADRYAAVRFIAHQSLKSLPGFEGFAYDFISAPIELDDAVRRAADLWRASPARANVPARPELLLGPGGAIDQARFDETLRARDNREIYLNE